MTTAAPLRAEAGREPRDRVLRGLVGEPSTLSPGFRTRWAAHNVRIRHDGIKRLHHHRGRPPGADLPVPEPAHVRSDGARPDQEIARRSVLTSPIGNRYLLANR
ncbi:MmyB family transcriptional regulator [Nonomuraea jabiensis]|uniref:MmyB family transcriptional regulator n=1 Tax=Nonomuraea jabiensis TaxID=882448 RepID=UPI00368B605D